MSQIYTTGSHSDETPGGQSQSRSKAPKNLSGGERSFSTVSLLLALWDTAMCPIRCLDEWDVFLDHVNRALAAKMLVSPFHRGGVSEFKIKYRSMELERVTESNLSSSLRRIWRASRLPDPIIGSSDYPILPETSE